MIECPHRLACWVVYIGHTYEDHQDDPDVCGYERRRDIESCPRYQMFEAMAPEKETEPCGSS